MLVSEWSHPPSQWRKIGLSPSARTSAIAGETADTFEIQGAPDPSCFIADHAGASDRYAEELGCKCVATAHRHDSAFVAHLDRGPRCSRHVHDFDAAAR